MIEPFPSVPLHEPQRQSLFAILFLALKAIRSIGIVQLVIGAGFVLSRSPSLLIVIGGVFVIGLIFLIFSALSWWRYTFAVVDGELQVNQGVLSRQTLTVPLDRVQSVSIEQKLLHRVLGLVQVTLDTAGTSTAEFSIDAVDQEVATSLQRAAADFRRAPANTPGGIAADEDSPFGTDPSEMPKVSGAETVLLKHDSATDCQDRAHPNAAERSGVARSALCLRRQHCRLAAVRCSRSQSRGGALGCSGLSRSPS